MDAHLGNLQKVVDWFKDVLVVFQRMCTEAADEKESGLISAISAVAGQHYGFPAVLRDLATTVSGITNGIPNGEAGATKCLLNFPETVTALVAAPLADVIEKLAVLAFGEIDSFLKGSHLKSLAAAVVAHGRASPQSTRLRQCQHSTRPWIAAVRSGSLRRRTAKRHC